MDYLCFVLLCNRVLSVLSRILIMRKAGGFTFITHVFCSHAVIYSVTLAVGRSVVCDCDIS